MVVVQALGVFKKCVFKWKFSLIVEKCILKKAALKILPPKSLSIGDSAPKPLLTSGDCVLFSNSQSFPHYFTHQQLQTFSAHDSGSY